MNIYVAVDENNTVKKWLLSDMDADTVAFDDLTYKKVPNAVSGDGMSVQLNSGSISIYKFAKHLDHFQLMNNALTPIPGANISGDNTISELNMDAPLSFKRANTVVNLGRL